MTPVSEKLLEDEITTHLVAEGGYRACKVGTVPETRQDFDARLGFDLAELFVFIKTTQALQWNKLVKAHGGAEDRARQRFAQRLAQQIDERGTVDVLRHGVRDQNVEIRLSYRKPAFGVAPELVAHYDANRLTVTRQLPFDPESNKSLGFGGVRFPRNVGRWPGSGGHGPTSGGGCAARVPASAP